MMLHGVTPTCRRLAELVGFTVSVAKQAITAVANKEADKAIDASEQVHMAPLTRGNKVRAVETKVLAINEYGRQWTQPILARTHKPNANILKCIRGLQA